MGTPQGADLAQMLLSAADAAHEAISISDRDRTFLYVNAAHARLFSFDSPEQMVGLRWDQFYAPEEAADLSARVLPELEATGGWHGQVEIPTAEGRSTFALSATIVPGGRIMSVLSDVSDEAEIQAALEASDERFRMVVSATRETIWDADLRTGLTTWTGAIGRMFGLPDSSFQFDEAWWLQHIHPDDKDRIVNGIAALLESDSSTWEAEYRFRRTDDAYAHVLERGHVVRDADGRALRFVGSMMDITGRKRREAQLAQARREAEEASQAKSLFLANMSHEIRTPMNGVIGMVELLLGTPLNDEQRSYAETIRHSGNRLLDIINDILDLSKIEAGKMVLETVDFDLDALVEETASLFAAQAGQKGLSFTIDVAPRARGRFHGDPGRLGQVLTNLLSNAVKFTDTGSVALEVDVEEGGDGWGDVAAVRFAVCDTGIGIGRAQFARLFQPFSQADESMTRRYGGTGLGLSITGQLVELMGGCIDVESDEEGSEFTVLVPLRVVADPARSRVTVPQQDAPTEEVPDPESRRLLLVEDNEVNQQVATLMLNRLGYPVDVVGNGAEALEALDQEAYSAVLMDVHMPVMDGIEATRRVRERETTGQTVARHRAGHLPIIAMTASALKGDRERMLMAGMDDYLAKPVRLDELDGVLRRWTAAAASGAGGSGASPHPGGPAASDVLDEDIVQSLVAMGAKARPGFLERLYTTFVEESATAVDDLEAALGAGDAEAGVQAAHGLKGSSASMGARALSSRCAEVVALCRAGDVASALPLVGPLREECQRACDALRTALSVDDRSDSASAV